jgi:hypothetical protein
MNNCCSNCYKAEPAFKCGGCKSRKYCSDKCKIQDWKEGGHKLWCGAIGELGKDYEIRLTDVKGLGMFALRNFERGEKIAIEKPILTFSSPDLLHKNIRLDGLLESQVEAIRNLAPSGSSNLYEKIALNMMSNGNSESCLMINLSRINHDCIGNSDHLFEEKHKLMLLIANCPIRTGDEITFSYSNKTPHFLLREKWGIECNCEHVDKLQRIKTLDDEIYEFGSTNRQDKAIASAKELLKIYDDLKLGILSYSRTYYDLFSISVSRKKTLNDAMIWIKKALEEELLKYSGCKDQSLGNIDKYKRYVSNPSSHPNYLVADRF